MKSAQGWAFSRRCVPSRHRRKPMPRPLHPHRSPRKKSAARCPSIRFSMKAAARSTRVCPKSRPINCAPSCKPTPRPPPAAPPCSRSCERCSLEPDADAALALLDAEDSAAATEDAETTLLARAGTGRAGALDGRAGRLRARHDVSLTTRRRSGSCVRASARRNPSLPWAGSGKRRRRTNFFFRFPPMAERARLRYAEIELDRWHSKPGQRPPQGSRRRVAPTPIHLPIH